MSIKIEATRSSPEMSDEDAEKLRVAAAMIEIALGEANFARAHRLLASAQKEYEDGSEPVTVKTNIYHVGLSMRTANTLYEKLDVRTVDDAMRLKRDEFESVPKVGNAGWNELIDCLHSHGFEHPSIIRPTKREH